MPCVPPVLNTSRHLPRFPLAAVEEKLCKSGKGPGGKGAHEHRWLSISKNIVPLF